MDRWETGMLAKSLAGHDKDKVYVIVGLDEQFTYLADGERKTLQSPKKKKKKHDVEIEISAINNEKSNLMGKRRKKFEKWKGPTRSLNYIEPIHTPYITVYRF